MNEPVRRWRARDHVPSLVLCLVGIAFAAGIGELVRRRARVENVAILERRAVQIRDSIKVTQMIWVEVLHHLGSFFRASDEVTRQDFRDFVRPALARHPEVAAIEWFPLIRGDERAALEERARADGLAGYRVREVGPEGALVAARERPQHLPLYYMEPMSDSAIGLDLYGDARRRDTADQARDSGEPAVSARTQLVEDPAGVWSVVVEHPIYRRGEPTATLEERRAAFVGVVAEVFRMQPTMSKALAGVDLTHMHVALEDATDADHPQLLFEGGAGGDHPLEATIAVPFAGRAWQLRFSAAPDGLVSGVAPFAVFLMGTIISMVAALLLSAWRMVLRLRREVESARSVGQYTLLERLGEGGMGVVYKARHALLRRPTAVKILQRERAAESDFKRFEREVQITGLLTHPNTVVVFDYGRTPDGRFYYAMEYIDGITLEKLITQFGPQPAGRVVHILEQACGALAEAHGAGLIHRDVKPANFMLCQRGGVADFVKVLDFGMVKERGIVSDVSETGVSYGTPLYLAPEAISDPKALDLRADLYALGLVGYYLLAGQRAVGGGTLAEVMHQHLSITPPRPSERLGAPLPSSLEAVIMRCLAKNPAHRPASAEALRRELLDVVGVPAWTPEKATAWWQSHHGEVQHVSQPVEDRAMDIALSERRFGQEP